MGPVKNLYYALGEVAYAISQSDGIPHGEVREKLINILIEEFKEDIVGFDSVPIISHILEKDRMDVSLAYIWATEEIKLNSHFMTQKMKKHFIHILTRIMETFPPATKKEQCLINAFINEITVVNNTLICQTNNYYP